MSSLDRLTELFGKLPGIGPRQARRFVFYLLATPEGFRRELADAITGLRSDTRRCSLCFRFHSAIDRNTDICNTCSNESRDSSQLMIVAKDVDFENVERSGLYKGYYFVLGGTVPILSSETPRYVREKDLIKTVDGRKKMGLTEIILALPANPDGDNTEKFVKNLLTSEENKLKISALGRGLSTGSELEYVDSDTIRNALANRG
ncbi:recombination protein RecR [bacterium]|nr:recombination protein RecR [bacterium]